MKIVIAGSSGLIGCALVESLRAEGHEIVRLVRRTPSAADEMFWDPAKRDLDLGACGDVDAIVNLAGENIAAGRWTAARKERILRSRTEVTQTLVLACARVARKPRVFVSASAVGIYGGCGDSEVTEQNPVGFGFLPEVAMIWETNAEGAARAGIRTVLLRFGVVLAGKGGALAKMLPIFRLGLGGRLGDGKQWMSWVGLTDAVGAIRHVLSDARCAGPVNVVSPEPATNHDFTVVLAHVLGRPAFFPVPGLVLRLIFGAMAEETMLVSTRALPGRLLDTGFVFREPNLEAALRAELSAQGGQI